MVVEQIDLDIPAPPAGYRTPGVHISSVIRNIAYENRILKPEQIEDFSLVEVVGRQEDWWNALPPDVKLKIAMGLAWEEWYMPKLTGVNFHPGEIRLDDIYMTPDGESIDFLYSLMGTYEHALHECKLTYKSTKTVGDLASQWMWLAQTKAYAKGTGTRIVYVHVNFACGDYTYPIRPKLKVWKVTFTQLELDDNWALMTAYVNQRQNAPEDFS